LGCDEPPSYADCILSYIIFRLAPIFAARHPAHAANLSVPFTSAQVLQLLPFVVGFFAFASLGHAQTIHKCVGPEGLMYRDTPCAASQQKQPFTSDTKNENQRSDSNVDQRSRQTGRRSASSYAGTPFAATTIFIGMTDTRVLNLPSWGRPAQIRRSKARQGWREQWVYKRPGDEWHHLYFENGRLAAQEDVSPPLIEARVSSEQ
jgi:hypothetical protein